MNFRLFAATLSVLSIIAVPAIARGKRDINGFALGMTSQDISKVSLPVPGPCRSLFTLTGAPNTVMLIDCGDREKVPRWYLTFASDARKPDAVIIEVEVQIVNQLTPNVMLQEVATQFGFDSSKPPLTRPPPDTARRWLLENDASIEFSSRAMVPGSDPRREHVITLRDEKAIATINRQREKELQDSIQKNNPRPKF